MDHPAIATAVRAEHSHQIADQQRVVMNFDYLLMSVWKTINLSYTWLPGPQQMDASGEAIAEILKAVNKIRKRCANHASFGTKRNGLEALRKIGEIICLGTDTIGDQIRKEFHFNGKVESLMLDILRRMTSAERFRVAVGGNGRPFVEEMDELGSLAVEKSTFMALGVIAWHLRTAEEGQGTRSKIDFFAKSGSSDTEEGENYVDGGF